MQVVLLAAGQSSRFVPFTNGFPHKSLVKIAGRTLLEHTLSAVKKSGIEDVVIVVGKNSPIEAIFGDGKDLGLKIAYITLPEPLGMGAAILAAKKLIQDKFFVLNAHHMEFGEFYKKMADLQTTEQTVVLLGKKGNEYGKYGFMKIDLADGENLVAGVIEKPEKDLGSWHRVVGIYLLNKTFLEVLEKTPLSHYHFEKALDEYAKEKKVKGYITDKGTLTLKYAWDLFSIKDYILGKIPSFISKSAKISKGVQISGQVFIDENATIMEGAKIKGPCYIGKNAYVGTNSLIRNNSCLEEQSVAGSFIELKNVLLMGKSTTHTGVIEDSIIGENCKIAAGIITANVRLDRKEIWSVVKDEKINTGLTSFGLMLGNGSQLGVRVTTMPGTIIGEKCLIGPYTVVMKNLSSNTKYYTEFKEVIEKNE